MNMSNNSVINNDQHDEIQIKWLTLNQTLKYTVTSLGWFFV